MSSETDQNEVDLASEHDYGTPVGKGKELDKELKHKTERSSSDNPTLTKTEEHGDSVFEEVISRDNKINQGRKCFTDWKRSRESLKRVIASDRVVKNIDKVIFPYNKWIKRWDTLMLTVISIQMILLPYQIGVQGVELILYKLWWTIFSTITCVIFLVDSIFYFRRPYVDGNGKWVTDLRAIRRHYLRNMFIADLLTILPYDLVYYLAHDEFEETTAKDSIILVASLLKLLRLLRLRRLFETSDVIMQFRMKHKSKWLRLGKYTFMIIIFSHFVACLWCWVAYLENEGLDFEKSLNWISGWVASSGGGDYSPKPYGFQNHVDRYVLALFWAIQTITSIGYGNIVPQTVTEWWVACIVQLIAAISWAYFLGGLIKVAAGFNEREEAFSARIDDANELIKAFRDDKEVDEHDHLHQYPIEKKDVARRIRRYIYRQYRSSGGTAFVLHFDECFPVMKTLPPTFQEQSSVLLYRKYFDFVPYLSSYYLGARAQSEVVKQCVMMEIAAGELIEAGKDLGRGIYIMQTGSALSRLWAKNISKWSLSVLVAGSMVGMGRVLLEDGHDDVRGTRMLFLTFSRVLFIPRAAIITALEQNPEAWKESGRWNYARAALGKYDTVQAY